ncbi:MAG TPA: CU044_5270 family protein [Pilimelia sp.]|nr:CU044_5270 family protein [Pilimelia sp.]
MDDLDLVRRLRAGVSPADPVTLAAARAELLREARGVGPRPRHRWDPRLRWGLAATGGLAAVLTGALAVGALPGTPPPAGGSPGVAASLPGGGSPAAVVLRNAAYAAQAKPALTARPDQFVFVESVTAYSTMRVEHGRQTFLPPQPTLRRVWRSADGTRDGLLWQRPRYGGAEVRTPLDGCRTDAGAPPPDCAGLAAFRTDLPTSGDAMLAWLYAQPRGKRSADAQAFTAVGDLIRETYLPPPSLAALFSAASRIPGVTVRSGAVDVAGRTGVGIGMPGADVELVFDRQTYEYVGERGHDPTGATIGSAQLRMAVVDRPGQLP